MTAVLDALEAPANGRPLRIGMLIGSLAVAGGGVPEAMRALCLALASRPGISVEVFSLRDDGREMLDFGEIPVHLARASGPSTFGYAADLDAMIAARRLDILHVHGLWMYLSVAARRWHGATGRPYLVSPHGMLDPWALQNGRWKKRIARKLYEDAHLKNAACIHALCGAEEAAVRAAGIARPVVILPNGVADIGMVEGLPPWRAGLPANARVLLFLGRLTPKKGVGALIRAWSKACPTHPDWHLALVGPDEGGYARDLDKLAGADPAATRIHIVGPAYGRDRARAYAAATAFILPSLSEGLPLAPLEAMSRGIPALLTRECNLPEAFEAGSALPMGTSESAIADGLRTLFELSPQRLQEMGERGRELVSSRFNWQRIGDEFANLYRRIGSPGADGSAGPDLNEYGSFETGNAPVTRESGLSGQTPLGVA